MIHVSKGRHGFLYDVKLCYQNYDILLAKLLIMKIGDLFVSILTSLVCICLSLDLRHYDRE